MAARWGGDFRGVRTLSIACWAACLALGCGKLSGIDDYRIGEPPPPPDCGPLGAPVEGRCEPAGVLPESCAPHFTPDGQGGCIPDMPPDHCPPGQIAVPGTGCGSSTNNCFNKYDTLSESVLGCAGNEGTDCLYVDASASASLEDGTKTQPFRTLSAAVDAANTQHAKGIFVAPGHYAGPIRIEARFDIYGACSGLPGSEDQWVVVEAPPDAADPVIRILPSAESVGIQRLQIVGGAAGVAADGVTLSTVAVHVRDTAGPGFLVEDTSAPCVAQLSALVERAVGSGVLAYGARVEVADWLVVRDTAPRPEDGTEGYGIALHASTTFRSDAVVPSPKCAAPASGELKNTVLEGNAGAGLLADGADATVDASVIRDTVPNGSHEAHGIVVQRRPLGAIPASLTLTRSVVSGNAGVGVLVTDWPAPGPDTLSAPCSGGPPPSLPVKVTIKDSVIRGSPDSGSLDECQGNGLRARGDGATGEGEAPIVLRHSLVEGARESGVDVQGASVAIESSIIRNTAASACGDSGDGVAVYADSKIPSAVTIWGSRIDASARAGVASFGGRAQLENSAVRGCTSSAIASVERGGVLAEVVATTSACRCGGSGQVCAPEARNLVPMLRGGNGCDIGDGVCWRICWDDIGQRLSSTTTALPTDPVAPLAGVVMWVPENLDIAPALSGADGCIDWGGLPASSQWFGALVRDGYLPTFWTQTTGEHDSVPVRSALPGDFVYGVWRVAAGRTPDARKSPITSVFACRSVDPSADRTKPADICIGQGVAGITLAAVEGIAADPPPRPLYVNDTGVLDNTTPTMTSAAIGGFLDGGPGDVAIRLVPGTWQSSVRCRADAFGDGWAVGDVDPAGDVVRMPTRPAALGVAFAYCDVQ